MDFFGNTGVKSMADPNRLAIGQKLLIFALAVVVLFSTVACGAAKGDPLAYRFMPLRAEICGNIHPSVGVSLEFSATLELFEYSAEGTRAFSLSFHAPHSLSGLSVCRDNEGYITVSMQGLALSLEKGDAVSGFIKIAEMLAPDGETVGISSIPGNSVCLGSYPRLTLIEMPSGRIYLDPSTSLPVRAEFSDGETEISYNAVTCGI